MREERPARENVSTAEGKVFLHILRVLRPGPRGRIPIATGVSRSSHTYEWCRQADRVFAARFPESLMAVLDEKPVDYDPVSCYQIDIGTVRRPDLW